MGVGGGSVSLGPHPLRRAGAGRGACLFAREGRAGREGGGAGGSHLLFHTVPSVRPPSGTRTGALWRCTCPSQAPWLAKAAKREARVKELIRGRRRGVCLPAGRPPSTHARSVRSATKISLRRTLSWFHSVGSSRLASSSASRRFVAVVGGAFVPLCAVFFSFSFPAFKKKQAVTVPV